MIPDDTPGASRRALLVAAAGLLAGCAGSDGGDGGDGGTPTRTRTDTPTVTRTRRNPRETTTGRPTATEPPGTVHEGTLGETLTVRGAVVETSPAFPTVHSFPVDATELGADVLVAPAGRQFAFVGLGVSGEGLPETGSYALEVGGERFGPVAAAADADLLYTPVPREPAYQQALGEGFLAFALPAALPDGVDATLVLDHRGSTGRWTVPEDLLTAARAPAPAFELVGVDAPDSAAPGTQFDVTATLRNTGAGRGTAWVTVRELPDGVVRGGVTKGVVLDPGQAATVTATMSSLLGGDDVSRIEVVVRTSGGARSLTVPVS